MSTATTRYDVSVVDPGPLGEAALAEVKAAIEREAGCNPFEKRCVWYRGHRHCVRVSNLLPGVCFRICGAGDVSGEWCCFYRGGKSEAHELPKQSQPLEPERI